MEMNWVFLFANDDDRVRAGAWLDAGPGVLDRLCLSLGPHEFLWVSAAGHPIPRDGQDPDGGRRSAPLT